jgi:2-methylcitrate dehydratase PrpD
MHATEPGGLRGPEVLYRGIWPTYFGTSFATAAVAARLMRLSRPQTAHALALTLSSPWVGQHHAATTARWFPASSTSLATPDARETMIALMRDLTGVMARALG